MRKNMQREQRGIIDNFVSKEYQFRCVIAGGGTGGHLFPAIAVANEMKKRIENTEVLFIAGRKRMESEILARYGFKVESIDVEGLKGRGWKKGFAVLISLPRCLIQAASIIKSFSPSVVLGVGGYSSGPACLSAKLLGMPTGIHEQNTYPGLTNRLLSRVVDRIFVSFEESSSYFKNRSVLLTGNPVREDLFNYEERDDERHDKFSLLILGGSQGARSINKVIPDCLAYLRGKEIYPDVLHQTGKADFESVIDIYKSRGLKGRVVPFIEDMKSAYHNADLVVSRAGATTIFELAAAGKPSILVPYPHAANQHQEINAKSLVQNGGAEMIREVELRGEVLAKLIMKYVGNYSALNTMGQNAKKMARADAAKIIVDNLLEMSGIQMN
jgi:UDP-N-acetylglucosamine--N-acetylmuramyl-(pentapeptide) pyrophosphoryl-undecaprenol N-acetylglucosamine transferase